MAWVLEGDQPQQKAAPASPKGKWVLESAPSEWDDSGQLPPTPSDNKTSAPQSSDSGPNALQRYAHGFLNPVISLGQNMQHGIESYAKANPLGPVDLMNRAATAIRGAIGAPATAADVDKAVATREADYQASRRQPQTLSGLVSGEQPPEPGIDWLNIAGNVTNPLNFAIPGGEAATLLGLAGKGALQGAISASLQPVTSGNFQDEKLKQMALGGAAGGVINPAIQKIVAPMVAGAVNKVSRALSKEATPSAEAQLQTAAASMGYDWQDVPSPIRASFDAEVQRAVDAGGTVDAKALLRKLDFERLGMKPTLGQITREPGQFTQERNLRGIEGAGEPLTQRFNEQNSALIEQLNKQGAAEAPGQFSTSQNLIEALRKSDSGPKQAVDDLYGLARGAEGRPAALDSQAFLADVNNKLRESMLSTALPSEARNLINGIAKGEIPLQVDTAEQLKTVLGDLGSGASVSNATRKALALVRSSLDATPISTDAGVAAREAFDTARAAASARFNQLEVTPSLKAALNGEQPDKFFQKYVLGGTQADLRNMGQVLPPEAKQAVNNEVVNYLKTKALNGASDETGNFSQSAYNKALRDLEPKIAAIMPTDQIEVLRRIGRVASYIQAAPAGNSVNTSNSAVAALNMLSKLGSVPYIKDYLVKPLQGHAQRGQVEQALAARIPSTPISTKQVLSSAQINSIFGHSPRLLGMALASQSTPAGADNVNENGR
jgi:hypothetical protein